MIRKGFTVYIEIDEKKMLTVDQLYEIVSDAIRFRNFNKNFNVEVNFLSLDAPSIVVP